MSEINTDIPKIDFLRFSAYSFKDMITRKLSENTNFTDQIYEGSNLAILIDLCAYLFQGMTYCINTAASESMFSDTQIYQNISRLVKLIGYNPKGFIPSECMFSFSVEGDYDDIMLPRYTSIDTNKYDSHGNKIYYSLGKDDYMLANGINEIKLYNGRWYLYETIFVASGTRYETFVLDNVVSNTDLNEYAAHGFIDVYVKRKGQFIRFQGLADEIFSNTLRSYDSEGGEEGITIFKATENDRYYSIRLNENKCYEIKFGNDNNGQKLEEGDQIYVFYLKSNGFDAQLTIGELQNAKFVEPSSLLGLTDDMFYKSILYANNDFQLDINIASLKTVIESIKNVTNITNSTTAYAEESVEDIRHTAPDYYKLGNRLVSKQDYEYYIKNRYKGSIIDVICQNNWDYISTFFGWLYRLGLYGIRTDYTTSKQLEKRESNPRYYINQSKLIKYDYIYADPADENNVYLWIKMQNNNSEWKDMLDTDLSLIKTLTAEMVYVDPIIVEFEICAAPIQRALDYFDTDTVFDSQHESYLEITIIDNALYSNASIKAQVNAIFNAFFNVNNMNLGQVININDLESQIYAIPGVQRIRTVFSSAQKNAFGDNAYDDRFIDGISFATWSSTLIEAGDDLVVSTINRTLEDFQFPHLYSSSIIDKIKVIKKSFSNNSTVQY